MSIKNDSRMNVIGLASVYDLLELIGNLKVEWMVDCGTNGDVVNVYPAIAPARYTLCSGELLDVSFGLDNGYKERFTDLHYPKKAIPFFSVKHKWGKRKAKVTHFEWNLKNLSRFIIKVEDENDGVRSPTVLKPARDFYGSIYDKFLDLFKYSICSNLAQTKRIIPESEYEEIASGRWKNYVDLLVVDNESIPFVKGLGHYKPSHLGWLD